MYGADRVDGPKRAACRCLLWGADMPRQPKQFRF
jgi:hypothetical protein